MHTPPIRCFPLVSFFATFTGLSLTSPYSFPFLFSSPLSSPFFYLPQTKHSHPKKMIPTYSFPCLAHSTDNTALFLVGVTDTIGLINVSQLEFNTVDLTYIDTPSVRLLHSEVDLKRWSPSAPKLCSNYPGAITMSNKPERGGRAVNPRIHIQQFSGSWTFDLNAVPGLAAGGGGGVGVGGAGDTTFEKPKKNNKNNLSSVSFLSPKQFAIVGQAGENMYGVGMTDEVNKKVGSSWRMFVVDATEDVNSLVSGPPQWSPSETTLLALGTFITTTTTTAGSIGHLTAFDSTGTSGQIFPTVSSDKQVQIRSPFPVQMNNITLSSGAIPVHQGGTGFILDQAKDGTVLIYSITPGQSPDLLPVQPVPASNVPRFSEFMVATSTTGGSDSRIVIYSVIEGNPRFNSFDVGVKVWSGPALIPQSIPFGRSGGGGLIPTTSLPDSGNRNGGSGNGNGVDGSGSSGKAPSGAVIGGAVAGGLILIVLAALFIVRSRKQRSSHASHREKGSNRGGVASALGREENGTDEEGGEEEGLALSDYHRHHQETLSSRPAPGEFRSFASAGSFATSNTTASSSSAVPLIYMSPPPLAPRPNSTPPISLPLLAQRPLLSQTQPQHQQQQQHVTQQLYNAGRFFSDSTIYQAQQPIRAATFPHRMDTYSPNRNQAINGNGNGDDDEDDNDEEPYTLPAPIIVAPTPKPHKAELFD
ncbi:MAG: hypothetical protein J3R72DRAFT_479068 [Linnemannia gamsii]|nr:MAG: hypothetical protein J3R72DRAFT_479068 [Linnemannia gamsii]